MLNFIVWDKERKIFLDKNTDVSALDNNDTNYDFYTLDEWYPVSDASVVFNILDIDKNIFSTHQDIGKKDINGKNIYADCSILKGRWLGAERYFYFKFDNEKLSYLIVDLNTKNENIYNSVIDYVSDLKIIDTIQENKLGLID